MNHRIALPLALTLALAGCSAGAQLLGLGKDAPDERNVRTGQSLAMPPDLNLPAPNNADAAYVPPSAAPAANLEDPDASADGEDGGADIATAPAPAPQAPKDIFAQYGVSRLKPDGTKKSDEELRVELREAQIAEKRRKNPNYGTFKNLGDLFKDG